MFVLRGQRSTVTLMYVYEILMWIGHFRKHPLFLFPALGAGLTPFPAALIPLRSVTWDRNNTTATGFQDVARALEQ